MWLTDKQRESIIEKLRGNRTVRRILPCGGRLFIDRQLPFICLYRSRGEIRDTGMDRITAGEAAVLSTSADRQYRTGVAGVLRDIACIMCERFGAYLILEIWPDELPPNNPHLPPQPLFTLYSPPRCEMTATVAKLEKSLALIRTSKLSAQVRRIALSRPAPPGLTPCIPAAEMRRSNIQWLGLSISPIYIRPESSELYPLLYRAVRRQVSRAMARGFFAFTRNHTSHHPPHFHTLGRRAVVKAVWEVDRQFAQIGTAYDLLRLVTPINSEAEWLTFQRNRCQKPPRFLYLPRPVDPGDMKRRLFSVPVERVEDPTLQRLFLDKRAELDRELSLIADLNREAFRFGGMQLHGTVKSALLKQAEELLADAHRCQDSPAEKITVSADEFCTLANREIAAYRNRHPGFTGSARVSDEMYGGMLVSRGVLIIGANSGFAADRCAALIQHEVGTHILTWSNGREQPLRLLAAGLPRYDEFQEGLAVLAEYLSGGFDPQRLHVLAARVVAVAAMIAGADFMEVFRMLTLKHGFTQRSAYLITMRVFRGGGFAKDAVYLRGLNTVLKYLAAGGSFENCFAGKMGGEHMPVYEELLLRRILKPPAVKPAYLDQPDIQEKLKQVAAGMTVRDLIAKRT